MVNFIDHSWSAKGQCSAKGKLIDHRQSPKGHWIDHIPDFSQPQNVVVVMHIV